MSHFERRFQCSRAAKIPQLCQQQLLAPYRRLLVLLSPVCLLPLRCVCCFTAVNARRTTQFSLSGLLSSLRRVSAAVRLFGLVGCCVVAGLFNGRSFLESSV